jgi:hypothetical protein
VHDGLRAHDNCGRPPACRSGTHSLSRNTVIKIYRTVILPVALRECETWSRIKGATLGAGGTELGAEEDIWPVERGNGR